MRIDFLNSKTKLRNFGVYKEVRTMSELPKLPTMPEMSDELKIKNMTRLLQALTGAKGVKCQSYPMGDGIIILEDIEVDNVRFANTCGDNEYAGLVLEFEAEPCVVDPPTDEFFPANDAVINAEIWCWEDPWDTIDALREEVQTLRGR